MRINLIMVNRDSLSKLLVCACLTLGATAFFAASNGEWPAGDRSSWRLVPAEQWTSTGGRLIQSSPGDTTAFLLENFATPRDARISGDFTLSVRAGFNPGGYPLGENGRPNWRIYYRTIAFGVMADSANGLLAVFCRTNGSRNGIVRLVDGEEHWLVRPTGGQGVGLDIHDLREYRMSRWGNIVTVWLDSVPVFQTEDTLGVLDCSPVVCGPGPVGIVVEGMRLEDKAGEIGKLELPVAVDSFLIWMDTENTHVLRDLLKRPVGTVELGDSLFGWFGAEFGGQGWYAAGGQLTIPNFRFAPEATIEMWFRLIEVPKSGVPLLHFGFDGTRMDSTWLNRERGGPMAMMFPDSSIGLHFHEFGDANADLPGIFELGRWYHLAWVRKGGLHRIYVDGQIFSSLVERREVLSLYLPKYGDRELPGLQLNVGQNADHDWLTEWGNPYMDVGSIRAVPEALEPEQFMAANYPGTLIDENGTPYVFSLGSTSPNPFSPSTSLSISLPSGYERDVTCELLDHQLNKISEKSLENLKAGHNNINWYREMLEGTDYEAGVYYLRINAGGESRTRKIVVFQIRKPEKEN